MKKYYALYFEHRNEWYNYPQARENINEYSSIIQGWVNEPHYILQLLFIDEEFCCQIFFNSSVKLRLSDDQFINPYHDKFIIQKSWKINNYDDCLNILYEMYKTDGEKYKETEKNLNEMYKINGSYV